MEKEIIVSENTMKIIAILWLIFILAILILPPVLIIKHIVKNHRKYLENKVYTTAVVVDIIETNRGRFRIQPIVEFSYDGIFYRETAYTAGSYKKRYNIGETVDISFNPKRSFLAGYAVWIEKNE